MPLSIEARLKSGASLTADRSADPWENRLIVRSITNGIPILASILVSAMDQAITLPRGAYNLSASDKRLLERAQDPKTNLGEFIEGGIRAAAQPYFPLLHVFTNDTLGLTSGQGVQLRFSPYKNQPIIWKDTVRRLAIRT